MIEINIPVGDWWAWFCDLPTWLHAVIGVVCWYFLVGAVLMKAVPIDPKHPLAKLKRSDRALAWFIHPVILVIFLVWLVAWSISAGIIPPPWSKKYR